MHKGVRKRRITGTGGKDKTVVVGVRQRDGETRATVVSDRTRRTLHARVLEHVEPGATVYTDALESYSGLSEAYAHETVEHAERYVEGHIHTNGLENFWSLLKRGLAGTYVSVEPFHLFRYLDERLFAFNRCRQDDYRRFEAVLRAAA